MTKPFEIGRLLAEYGLEPRAKPHRFSEEWWESRTMVSPTTGCQVWMGAVCRQGYGRVRRKGRSPMLVHRLRYELAYGPFDAALKVCHRCDNPGCVNPTHLFLGTQEDNLRDMFKKGRGRPHGKAPRKKAQGGATATRNTLSPLSPNPLCRNSLLSISYAHERDDTSVAP